jgi:hypothetical protein
MTSNFNLKKFLPPKDPIGKAPKLLPEVMDTVIRGFQFVLRSINPIAWNYRAQISIQKITKHAKNTSSKAVDISPPLLIFQCQGRFNDVQKPEKTKLLTHRVLWLELFNEFQFNLSTTEK